MKSANIRWWERLFSWFSMKPVESPVAARRPRELIRVGAQGGGGAPFLSNNGLQQIDRFSRGLLGPAIVHQAGGYFSGVPGAEIPHPSRLRCRKGQRLAYNAHPGARYREIRTGDVFAALKLRTDAVAVRGMSWSSAPQSQDSESERAKEFVSKVQSALIGWESFLQDRLETPYWGSTFAQLIWEEREMPDFGSQPFLVPRQIIPQPLDCFAFRRGEDGLPLLQVRKQGFGFEAAPPGRFLHACVGGQDSPWGEALAECLYVLHAYAQTGLEEWAKLIALWSVPILLGYVDLAAAEKYKDDETQGEERESVAEWLSLLDGVIGDLDSNKGVSMPDVLSLETLESKRSGDPNHGGFLRHVRSLIYRLLTGNSGEMTGASESSGGSQARAQTGHRISQLIQLSDARFLDRSLGDFSRLVTSVNFGDVPAPVHTTVIDDLVGGSDRAEKAMKLWEINTQQGNPDDQLQVSQQAFLGALGFVEAADGEELMFFPTREGESQ